MTTSEAWLDRVLHRLIRAGELGVIWPDGRTSRYGSGGEPSARIRLADSAFYEDAFHLPAGPRSNDPHSVIVPPGRWRIGAPAMLRTRDRDVRVLFDHLLERDSGFDRVAIRTFEP